MFTRPSGKFLWLGIGVSLVLLAFGWVMLLKPRATPTTTTNQANPNRQHYAALYDAAWRQDDGRDATLVTATLFVPPTIAALGNDTGRSSTEEQLWNTMKSIDAKTIPIVLTFDSVTNSYSDEAITTSLQLQGSNGQKFTLESWQPVIAPTRIVNTAGSISSQSGVALFSSDQDIQWQTINSLKLTVTGIGGEQERIFSWTEPKLLLEL